VQDREFGGSPDLLVCDDSPGEIGDFFIVRFNPPKVVVVHCKSKPRKDGDGELRAVSELQEVVSQASKNLVYLSGRSQYPPHIDQWTKKGVVDGFSVPRILIKKRGLPEGKALWDRIRDNVLLSRNTEKEVWIIVGGAITKSWVNKEIEKCKRADSNLACLFHMVDGLGASCIEAVARLKVFCNTGRHSP
jgi:hypothetical protein